MTTKKHYQIQKNYPEYNIADLTDKSNYEKVGPTRFGDFESICC